MYLQSLSTSDLKQAMAQRDMLEREVRTLFARVKSGQVISSDEEMAEERGRIYREVISVTRREGDNEALHEIGNVRRLRARVTGLDAIGQQRVTTLYSQL